LRQREIVHAWSDFRAQGRSRYKIDHDTIKPLSLNSHKLEIEIERDRERSRSREIEIEIEIDIDRSRERERERERERVSCLIYDSLRKLYC
jgi:hypothetical protein